MRAAVITIAVLLCGAAVALLVTAGGDDGNDGPATAVVDVGHPGRAVPSPSIGFSIEYEAVAAYAGPPDRRNQQFAQLVRTLADASGAPVRIRVGGNSTDQSWWNPGREPRPRTVLFDITPETLDSLAWISRNTGARVTLGVNFALNDPDRATAFARAAQRRLPAGALDALEIGNEPDLYATQREFDVGRLRLRRLRKRDSYSAEQYERELRAYVDALSGALDPAPRLIVGGFAGGGLLPGLRRVVETSAGQLGGLSTHLYALRRCEDKTPAPELIEQLGDPDTTRAMVDRAAPMLALGREHDLPVRITELNSAVCGGVPGVSDTFAATLWLAGALFELTEAGAAGADVHGFPGAYYTPIDVRGGRTVPRQPYNGMLLFARTARPGSRLVPVKLDGAPESLGAWATVDERGRVRVLLTATEPLDDPVRVEVPGAGRCTRPTHLRATSLESTSLEAYGRGEPACQSDGAYQVPLDAPGAVLLQFQARKPS